MKFYLLMGGLLLSCSLAVQAQEDSAMTAAKKNLIKLNLFALPLKNFTVQYERAIAKKTTLALNVRVMPQSTLPFKNSFRDAISDQNTKDQVDNFKTGNFALMPELRFYLSKRGAFHGFYIAPFFSYAHYTADLPYNYDDNGVNKTIPLSGNINTISGGLMFGAQWSLSKTVYLDWWIFGPHYGSCNGSISGQKSLSSSEQASLKSDLDNLDIPLAKISSTVNANGATVNFSGPWAGIRSGLALGIRF
jgi:hypothetical protein